MVLHVLKRFKGSKIFLNCSYFFNIFFLFFSLTTMRCICCSVRYRLRNMFCCIFVAQSACRDAKFCVSTNCIVLQICCATGM